MHFCFWFLFLCCITDAMAFIQGVNNGYSVCNSLHLFVKL